MKDVSQEIDLTIVSLCYCIRKELEKPLINAKNVAEITQALANLTEAKACMTNIGGKADIDKFSHQIQEYLLKQIEETL